MKTIVQTLKDRTKHYIFISTDSVYMACPSDQKIRTEDNDIRPIDKEQRILLKKERSIWL